jgi:uncharacterized membrane protein
MLSEKSKERDEFPEQRAEAFIGKLVRFLVIAAACIVAVGGTLYLHHYWRLTPGYHIFQSEPFSLRSPQGIIANTLSFDSHGLIQLGILLLIAIPLIRVAAFLVSFLRQRDWLYSVVTIIVFSLLLFSFFYK